MKKFLPFEKSGHYEEVLAIDCYTKKAFNLSHWRGAPKVAAIHADTSALIAIQAIEKNLPEIQYQHVTSNHFDIDGFLGVWSVFNPEAALKHKDLIAEMSLIGDFRELSGDSDLTAKALKLVCCINHLEQRYFYAPFASKAREAETCVEKFNYFLANFSNRFFDIDKYPQEWENEFETVMLGLQILQNPNSRITDIDALGLQIVETSHPLHYYAMFAKSGKSDMVLSMYDNNRYELEYKYSTWVDTNRVSYPRIDLSFLAARLNALEKSGLKWEANPVSDTGPILRLNKEKLSKEARFDHPFTRSVYSSGISPDVFREVVQEFFDQAYHNITPKKWWTWKEIAHINANLTTTLV